MSEHATNLPPVEAERRESAVGVLMVDSVCLAALAAVRASSPIAGAMPLMPVVAELLQLDELPLEFAVLSARVEILEQRIARLEQLGFALDVLL